MWFRRWNVNHMMIRTWSSSLHSQMWLTIHHMFTGFMRIDVVIFVQKTEILRFSKRDGCISGTTIYTWHAFSSRLSPALFDVFMVINTLCRNLLRIQIAESSRRSISTKLCYMFWSYCYVCVSCILEIGSPKPTELISTRGIKVMVVTNKYVSCALISFRLSPVLSQCVCDDTWV